MRHVANEVKLNSDKILSIVKEQRGIVSDPDDEDNGLSEFERDDSEYVAREESSSPEEGATQDPASSTPEPQPTTPDPVRSDLNQELLGMNKELLGLLAQSRQPAAAPVPEPARTEVRDPNTLAMYGDLDPLRSELAELRAAANATYVFVEQRVETEARTAWDRFVKDNPDAADVIDPQFGRPLKDVFEAAIKGVQNQSVQAVKGQRSFAFNWDSELQQRYDMIDAPRLRKREQERKEQEEIKAKQKAELEKVQGVPARGARYQPTAAQKSAKELKDSGKSARDGGTLMDGLRGRVSALVRKARAE